MVEALQQTSASEFKVTQISKKFLWLVHKIGFLYMKPVGPVTPMCLLTKPFIGGLKAWKIMTLLSLNCLDEMVALESGNFMALFHKSTI